MQPATPFRAIFRREMNEVLKTPVYLMNAVLSVMMMPIMLMGMSVGMTTADESIDIASVIAQLTGALEPTDLTLILAALFSFMVFMCPLTATAISREGKRLPIMRMIPVSARTILWAKLLVGVLIVLLGSVIMGAAIIVLLGTEFLPHVACAVLMANVLSVSVGAGSLLVDVLKPVLTWKSENEVMKQNMNTMYSMLISVVMAALVAVPVVLLLKQAAWLRMAVAALLLLLELASTILLLETVGCKRLSRLEP
jgi:ABC-2 type transport system permease protein